MPPCAPSLVSCALSSNSRPHSGICSAAPSPQNKHATIFLNQSCRRLGIALGVLLTLLVTVIGSVAVSLQRGGSGGVGNMEHLEHRREATTLEKLYCKPGVLNIRAPANLCTAALGTALDHTAHKAKNEQPACAACMPHLTLST